MSVGRVLRDEQGSAVWLLEADGVRAVRWLLRAAEAAGRLDGISPPVQVVGLQELARRSEVVSEVPARSALPVIGSEVAPGVDVVAQCGLMEPVRTQEAAQMLGCTARNVVDLCRRGRLRSASFVGGRWLVERTEVRAVAVARRGAA